MPQSKQSARDPGALGASLMVNGHSAPKKRRYGGGRKPSTRVADWGVIDAELLRGVVECVTSIGDGIILAVTSDGGAYAITILTDGEKPRYWPATAEECEERLRDIIHDAQAARDGD